MGTVTAPTSASEALDMVRAGLGYLAAADPTQLATETQAQILRELEQDEAVLTAVRAWSLAAFTAGQGHCADADYSPRAWLMHHTHHPRRRRRAHRLGAAGRRAPAGAGRDGRRADLRVLRPGPLHLGRQAPRRLPGGGG